MKIDQSQQDVIFEVFQDGIFVNISLNQIISDKTVLFASLPVAHDRIHHKYVNYLKSLIPYVDKICLITTSNRFTVVNMNTHWPDIPALFDKNLEFATWLNQTGHDHTIDKEQLKEWKYQCLFKDGQLIGLYESPVPDVKTWINDRLKNSATWKQYLKEHDFQIIKAFKLLIKKPELFYTAPAMVLMSSSLASTLLYDKLWPNIEIENLLNKNLSE